MWSSPTNFYQFLKIHGIRNILCNPSLKKKDLKRKCLFHFRENEKFRVSWWNFAKFCLREFFHFSWQSAKPFFIFAKSQDSFGFRENLCDCNFSRNASRVAPVLHIFHENFKGTQDWEFFGLRFWNLRYFFVSYVKILRFYKKKFLIGPLLGEVRFFRVVLFFCSSILDPRYDPILVFWKFNQLNAPGMTLCVDLGSKCQILFPLVLD